MSRRGSRQRSREKYGRNRCPINEGDWRVGDVPAIRSTTFTRWKRTETSGRSFREIVLIDGTVVRRIKQSPRVEPFTRTALRVAFARPIARENARGIAFERTARTLQRLRQERCRGNVVARRPSDPRPPIARKPLGTAIFRGNGFARNNGVRLASAERFALPVETYLNCDNAMQKFIVRFSCQKPRDSSVFSLVIDDHCTDHYDPPVSLYINGPGAVLVIFSSDLSTRTNDIY